MMKALSMPISSPSRAENFPPPLMGFLRSNVGSKSRGKLRSSPIFYVRSRRKGVRMIEFAQEPSSPKVTCIGQVKSTATKSGRGAAVNCRRRRCWLFKKALFCGKISSRFRKRAFRRFFCKWALFWRSGYCKTVDADEESFRVCSNKKNGKSENIVEFCNKKSENFGGGIQENGRDFVDDCSSQSSKNDLILTRCKSAPYKSSSLGGRFSSSPLAENGEKSHELQKPSFENEEKNSRICGEKTENSVENAEKLKEFVVGGIHPLLLTRCKSEPARRGERFNQEGNLWGQRRLD